MSAHPTNLTDSDLVSTIHPWSRKTLFKLSSVTGDSARRGTSGHRYEEIVAWIGHERGGDYRPRAKAAVLMTVIEAVALVSPAYDDGRTEAEVSASWRQRHLKTSTTAGE
jgi:hypothetical protein